VNGAEQVVASIEAVVGNIADAITDRAAVASNTASAAAAITPSGATVNATEAPIVPNVPTPAPPSTPTLTPASSTVLVTPSTEAASDNVFELQNAVVALAQGMQSLTALLEAQTPSSSSKIESQIASLQSALASQSTQSNAAAVYPLGDGTGIAAASNIGNLSGVTITNANTSAPPRFPRSTTSRVAAARSRAILSSMAAQRRPATLTSTAASASAPRHRQFAKLSNPYNSGSVRTNRIARRQNNAIAA
jgi:hypothetical protein